jgi:hypothetical protein
MSSVNRQPGGCFQTRPPREFTPNPLAPQKSAAIDDSITITAGEDSSCHGGEGGLVTLSAFATVATVVGGRVATSTSVDSSDDEVVSIHLAPLFGVGVCDDSPNFSDHNDLMPDSQTDNEVSKFHFTLVYLIIWKVTRLASPITLLSSYAFCLKQALLCATWIQ